MDLTDEDVDYARLVERAAWRSLIRATIVARLRSGTFASGPLGALADLGNSQLGGLRVMVRASDRIERLERLRLVENRLRSWGKAVEVLDSLFRDRDRVWEHLDAGDWPCLRPEGRASLREELWEEAVVTLVDEAARRDLVAGVQPTTADR